MAIKQDFEYSGLEVHVTWSFLPALNGCDPCDTFAQQDRFEVFVVIAVFHNQYNLQGQVHRILLHFSFLLISVSRDIQGGNWVLQHSIYVTVSVETEIESIVVSLWLKLW